MNFLQRFLHVVIAPRDDDLSGSIWRDPHFKWESRDRAFSANTALARVKVFN